MPIQTTTEQASLAAKYEADAVSVALYTTVPTSSAGTEVSGGSPAYARKTPTWSGTNPITATVTFDVPAGTTVKGVGLYNSGGTYIDGGAVGGASGQLFSSQGQYQITLTYTQS